MEKFGLHVAESDACFLHSEAKRSEAWFEAVFSSHHFLSFLVSLSSILPFWYIFLHPISSATTTTRKRSEGVKMGRLFVLLSNFAFSFEGTACG